MNTYLPEGIAGRASSFPSCSAPTLLPACTGVCAFHSLLRGHCNSSFTRDTLVPILGGPQSCHLVMGGKARDSQCAPLRSLFFTGATLLFLACWDLRVFFSNSWGIPGKIVASVGAAGPHCGSSGVIPGRHHTQGWPLVYSFGERSIIAPSLSCLKVSASLA